MSKSEERASFTLRFDDVGTHQALRLVAGHLGLSMNQLAQDLLARELRVAVLGVEDDLSETLQRIREYRGEDIEADLDAFADAEVDEEDPIQTKLDRNITADRLGVSAIFA
jgi:hypothetical protein